MTSDEAPLRPPKPTFDHLPTKKRERFVRAALTEIAEHDFAAVNLDRVSQAARVAKGSVYQYFHNKADLYAFAVRTALERSAALFEAHLAATPPVDAVAAVGQALAFAIELREREPLLARLYSRVALAGRVPDWVRPIVLAAVKQYDEAFQRTFVAFAAAPAAERSQEEERAASFIIDAVSTRFHARVLGDDPIYGLDRASPEDARAFARALAEALRGLLPG